MAQACAQAFDAVGITTGDPSEPPPTLPPVEGEEWLTATDSGSGSVTLAIQGRNSTIKDLGERISDWDTRLADRKARLLNIAWMPDGKNLMYVSADKEFENNVLWLQPLDAETPRQIASLGNEEIRGFGLSVSQNGKMMAIVQGAWLHDAVLLKGLK